MIPLIAARLINGLADVYTVCIVVWALFSWFPHTHGVLASIYNFLDTIVSPFVNIFRRFIPPIGGVLDISPIIALLVIQVVVRLLVGIFLYI
ncbi:MAG: YggT family protein [Coriobacteriales bacterium]|jgi:YggT family protein|nr:YggT family protein [Coriobacteriales bacterium]